MISIIIPTLNEARDLPRTMTAVRANETPAEIILVDAGSVDRTREVAAGLGAEVICSPIPQRAAQMNLGARHSRGNILLFLHADTVLPRNGLAKIQQALADDRVGGGAFARRFDSNSPFLRFTCWLATIRNVFFGWQLGDQAMFVRRNLFDELGGFELIARFEDLDFSRRLGRKSRLVTLRPPVTSSARRFSADGPVKRTFKDLRLTISYVRRRGDFRALNRLDEVAPQPRRIRA